MTRSRTSSLPPPSRSARFPEPQRRFPSSPSSAASVPSSRFGIAGLVFASLSRRRAGFDLPRNRKGRIMSIIGLIVSVLWLILYIILFVYAVNGVVDGTIPTPTEGFYFFNT